jgi:very-short-patch-repair endonuclease
VSRKKLFGFELLAEQASDHVRAMVGFWASTAAGDSPIEKLMVTALSVIVAIRSRVFTDMFVVKAHEVESFKEGIAKDGKSAFIVQPQAQLGDWRVDFLLHVPDWAESTGEWKQVVVECDGHDFHEKTKEQAAKDRRRDRAVQKAGIKVLRFTGSELWRDPMRCAAEVIDVIEGDL